MKKFLSALMLLWAGILHSQEKSALSRQEIEDIYSQAVNYYYDNDIAQARFLLETLVLEGADDEYLALFLMQIYQAYIQILSYNSNPENQEVVLNSYKGIRDNILILAEKYPDSAQIADTGLSIAWQVRDAELGVRLAQNALKYNPQHTMANYILGYLALSAANYEEAIPYFEKLSLINGPSRNETYIYQSLIHLGDIYSAQNTPSSKQKALRYFTLAYNLSQEFTEIPDDMLLNAKIGILQAYFLNFPKALTFFEKIPVELMQQDLLDIYLGSLLLSGDKNSIKALDLYLSQNTDLSPYAYLLRDFRRGKTQRALQSITDNSDFSVSSNFPWMLDSLHYELLRRFQMKDAMKSAALKAGTDAYCVGKKALAKRYLKLDDFPYTNGVLLYMLGDIEDSLNNQTAALKYYEQALKYDDFREGALYAAVQLELSRRNFSEARRLLRQYKLYPQEIFTLKKDQIARLSDEEKQQIKIMSILYAQLLLAEDSNNDMQAQQYVAVLRQLENDPVRFANITAGLYVDAMNISPGNCREYLAKARQYLESVLETDPDSLDTQNFLAYTYALQKELVPQTDADLDKALSLIENAVAEKDNIAYLDTWAWVHFMKGDAGEAQGIFTLVENELDMMPFQTKELTEIYVHLAKFYLDQGNIKKAKQFLRLGMRLNRNNRALLELEAAVKRK